MLNKLISRISIGFIVSMQDFGEDFWVYEVIDRTDKTRTFLCKEKIAVMTLNSGMAIPGDIADEILPFLDEIRENIMWSGLGRENPVTIEAMATLVNKIKEAGRLVEFDSLRADIPLTETHVFQIFYERKGKDVEGHFSCTGTDLFVPFHFQPTCAEVARILLSTAEGLDTRLSAKMKKLKNSELLPAS